MEKLRPDLIVSSIGSLVTSQEDPTAPLKRLYDVFIAVIGDKIAAIGPSHELQSRLDTSQAQEVDAGGGVAAPGFVDSHTHLVFGGTRVQEYTARFTKSAAEVQALGIPTGILATVGMTREATTGELINSARLRLDEMMAHGTTTVESKSGYGLTLNDELKMLEANRSLQADHPLDIISTFLGAHAFPPELSRKAYVDLVVSEMIPAIGQRSLAEFCDVYCDEGYFTVTDSVEILDAARQAGLKLKIHTDQYSALGGSALAAELGVVSADHLNYTHRENARLMAEAGVVGVLMPLIDFAVEHPHPFDARMFLEEGLSIALATDMCPGCWAVSMPLVIQFASRQHHLSPDEAFAAATLGGARALDLHDRGRLVAGLLADIQVWDVPTFEDAFYRLGHNPVAKVIKNGRVVYDRSRINGGV